MKENTQNAQNRLEHKTISVADISQGEKKSQNGAKKLLLGAFLILIIGAALTVGIFIGRNQTTQEIAQVDQNPQETESSPTESTPTAPEETSSEPDQPKAPEGWILAQDGNVSYYYPPELERLRGTEQFPIRFSIYSQDEIRDYFLGTENIGDPLDIPGMHNSLFNETELVEKQFEILKDLQAADPCEAYLGSVTMESLPLHILYAHGDDQNDSRRVLTAQDDCALRAIDEYGFVVNISALKFSAVFLRGDNVIFMQAPIFSRESFESVEELLMELGYDGESLTEEFSVNLSEYYRNMSYDDPLLSEIISVYDTVLSTVSVTDSPSQLEVVFTGDTASGEFLHKGTIELKDTNTGQTIALNGNFELGRDAIVLDIEPYYFLAYQNGPDNSHSTYVVDKTSKEIVTDNLVVSSPIVYTYDRYIIYESKFLLDAVNPPRGGGGSNYIAVFDTETKRSFPLIEADTQNSYSIVALDNGTLTYKRTYLEGSEYTEETLEESVETLLSDTYHE